MSNSGDTSDGTPSGWYDDPLVERWWDGANWTRLTRSRGQEQPDGPIVDPNGVVPVGWYADPLRQRFWDGASWTSQTRDLSAVTSTSPPADQTPPQESELESSPMQQQAAQPVSPAPPQAPKRRGRVVAIAVLGLAALGAGFGAVVLFAGQGGDADPASEAMASPTTATIPSAAIAATATTTTSTSTTTTTSTTSTSTTTTTLAPVVLTSDPYFVGLAAWDRVGAERMLAASGTYSPAWGYARHLQQGFRAGASPEGIATVRDTADGEAELCVGSSCFSITDVEYRGNVVYSFTLDGIAIDTRSRGWDLGDVVDCWWVDDLGCFSDGSATMHLTSIYKVGRTTYVSLETVNGAQFPANVSFSDATIYGGSQVQYNTSEVATSVRPGQTEVWLIVFGDVDVPAASEVSVGVYFGSEYYTYSLIP